jgi:hypothetical protein
VLVTPEGHRWNQRQAFVAAGLVAMTVKAELTPFRSVSAKMPTLLSRLYKLALP